MKLLTINFPYKTAPLSLVADLLDIARQNATDDHHYVEIGEREISVHNGHGDVCEPSLVDPYPEGIAPAVRVAMPPKSMFSKQITFCGEGGLLMKIDDDAEGIYLTGKSDDNELAILEYRTLTGKKLFASVPLNLVVFR